MLYTTLSGQQLGVASVKGYRELLCKIHAQAAQAQVEESPSVFLQARERVRLHLANKKSGKDGLDPHRAFFRLRQRLLDARTNIRELKNEKAEQLRHAVDSVRRQGLVTVQRAIQPDADAERALQQSTAERDVLGADGLFRSALIATAGAACKVFMTALTRTSVEGREHMQQALARPADQALITVSNHVASMDDPLVTAAVVPAKYVFKPGAVRWTMCATDRCFKHETLSKFFRAAKVLPVERGAGLQQTGMLAAESRLNAGDWVHIFPEGTRSTDGRLGKVRKGVGRLVAACERAPLVLPFVHSGMEKVIPRCSSLPRPGQDVRVLVGPPIQTVDLLAAAREQGWTQDRLYSAIADRVGEAMYALKAQLDGVPVAEVVRTPAAVVADEDSLLPLIEEEMESMRHPWGHRLRDTIGLASISSRVQSLALRLDSIFRASIQAANEELTAPAAFLLCLDH
ncbi:hypothetical protein WJX72_000637 [[Myrmecia] bisecta]|uniref:Tafazzin family protein n=1 Tax=[Myrmecia] bisecta TaxID=41462 RepID=A0AAW1QNX7_9CHLO